MTDATGGSPEDDPDARLDAPPGSPPADGPDDRPADLPDDRLDDVPDVPDDDADLGWRALAGSLDDLGFAPPPAAETERPDRAYPAPETPAALAAESNASDPAVEAATGFAAVAATTTAAAAADADADPTTTDPTHTRSGHPRPRQYSRGSNTLIGGMLVLALLIITGFTTTLIDKAVIAPGHTADIEEFVDVRDHPSYASDATISLVSVRTSFAPSLFEVIGGWLDGALEVVDLEDILGERTVAENRDAGRLQMDQSTQVAVAVALEHLGHEIMTPIGARIARVMPDAPADGALLEGDIVQAVGDTAITTAQQLSDTVKAHEPGATATFTALAPDGQTRTVTVTLAARDGVALLGVIVTTHVEFAEPPIDVRLHIENIGGPSAGLAFTLSVIDALTPEPLTGNLDVAATGTIHHDGSVGPIGGVPQKSHAVVRAGTDLFLVPASQVEEAVAVAEPSVAVVGVETLEEALAAIEAHRR
ncbi:PDZ domain-containing protein [Candidatus Poriferisodalis sp.]|uniref:YlbL family protein n=1 Tax=Candidatus Poriferisodalis sp. TaxID=3101277 RepID=UPI003B5B61A8